MIRFASLRRLTLVTALFVLAAFTTGCVGSRIGVSWASVSLIGDQQNILLAYHNYVVQIDPRSGGEIQLRDEEGNIRVVPETGEPRSWDFQDGSHPEQFYTAPLTLKDGKLLFANYVKKLVEVDLIAARVDNPLGVPIFDAVVADPIADENHIYLGYVNKNLQALDINSPSVVIWTFETGNGIWSEPLLVNGVLYFGAMDHYLYAVNADNGRMIWKTELGGAVASTPVLSGGALYIGSFARKVFKISQSTGEILQERAVEDWVWGSPVVRGGVVYTADMGGNVYALNSDDLSEKWRIKAANGGIRPSPLVTDEHVIVGARSGEVIWLDRQNGAIALEGARMIGAEILGDLILVESNELRPLNEPLVIVTTVANDNLLVAYSATQGVKMWVYKR